MFDAATERSFSEVFGKPAIINQCDGCAAGMPKTDLNMHYNDHGQPIMICQKSKYLTNGE